ncbi:hypothetical protein CEUSTIGMA_g4372.t1 [Chlamydomonas eustigma]|uniref:Uncharacterized protein n=1 Tax=Chlamydomonas eustigma TaxID=1157962 RepID=A0A250X1J0_9CHLO|nr:hypothetical protein CEUSTIGMA_g4372.t1 [Chlamydomonas eustigma]|eukprot:GAX76925.1 hypothetical protein CEUSTIGMA_g4372.t1 [Chlamydomonas eustigma]
MEAVDKDVLFWVATASASCAGLLSKIHIGMHIRNYHEPVLQRHVCRIIFMVVVMSSVSVLALSFPKYAIYMVTLRDCYDSFVIYNFVALCINLAGGPGAIVSQSENVLVRRCCLPPQQVDGSFLRRCKQGTLQFVILKPVLSILSLVLYWFGLLEIGVWSFTNGWIYIAIALSATYSTALFFLLQFYLGTKELLSDYRPGLKFLLIKAIIFVTFWQGIALTILLRTGTIGGQSDAEHIQNLLMCFEMLGAALCMLVAFPWSEYAQPLPGQTPFFISQPMPLNQAFVHAVSVSDVVQDLVHQFSNEYSAYVLHNDSVDPILEKQKKDEKRRQQENHGEDGHQGGRQRLQDLSSNEFSRIAAVEMGTSGRIGEDRRNLLLTDQDPELPFVLEEDEGRATSGLNSSAARTAGPTTSLSNTGSQSHQSSRFQSGPIPSSGTGGLGDRQLTMGESDPKAGKA